MITRFASVEDFFRHAWDDWEVFLNQGFPESSALYWVFTLITAIVSIISFIRGSLVDGLVTFTVGGFAVLCIVALVMWLISLVCSVLEKL
jgi:hypothetical protein